MDKSLAHHLLRYVGATLYGEFRIDNPEQTTLQASGKLYPYDKLAREIYA